MNADLAECVTVEGVQQAVQVAAQFVVEARDELRDLLLCDRGGQINVPDGQAGEVVIAREQTVQEGGPAAEVAQDEKWLFNWLRFVSGEENVIQEEAEPVRQSAQRPDQIEKKQKDQSFAGQAGWRAFPFEERAVEHAPKQSEIVSHKEGEFLNLPQINVFSKTDLFMFIPGLVDTQKGLAASWVWAILTENQTAMKNKAMLAA
jgi:hypothetical protein